MSLLHAKTMETTESWQAVIHQNSQVQISFGDIDKINVSNIAPCRYLTNVCARKKPEWGWVGSKGWRVRGMGGGGGEGMA